MTSYTKITLSFLILVIMAGCECSGEEGPFCVDLERPNTAFKDDVGADKGVSIDGGTPLDSEMIDMFVQQDDSFLTPDDGVLPPDEGMDPDDGVLPPDEGMDPDDSVLPPDEGMDPDDSVLPPDEGMDPDDGVQPDMGEECMPGIEVCNGLDDDCDEAVDEGTLNQCGECGSPPREVCNGLDDNCDGVIDDGFAGLGVACERGIGACRERGMVVCEDHQLNTRCDAIPGQPAEDDPCDGIDNDCDSTVDEDANGEEVACGVGVCRHMIVACNGGGQNECDPFMGAQEELCNELDDDCDGETDEEVLNACGECGPVPQELCNGEDDNCDGQNDETFVGLGGACFNGVGACQREGTSVCNGDGSGIICNAIPGIPLPSEQCNGADDDCDGEVDEDAVGVGGDCEVGVGECFREGGLACNGGILSCDAEPGQPQQELCSQRDEDCDGEVDEDIAEVGEVCHEGLGVCRSEGEFVCSAMGLECMAFPGEPEDESCNELDDDCDGEVDEDLFLTERFSLQVCTDLLVDSELGLLWERSNHNGESLWQEASDNCAARGMRMPTANESRSLITGCPDTVTGGICQLGNDCTNAGCESLADCMCQPLQGPAAGRCYWVPDVVEGDCNREWTSTCDPQSDNCLAVDYSSGRIGRFIHNRTGGVVRCVRDN